MGEILITGLLIVYLVFSLTILKIVKGLDYKININDDYNKTHDPAYKLISLTHSLLYKYVNKTLNIKKYDPILRKVTLLTGFNNNLSGYDKVLSDKLMLLLENNDYFLKTRLVGNNTTSRMAIIEIYWLNTDNLSYHDDSELIYREKHFIVSREKEVNENFEKMV